ncbi:hypothetical protein GCM10009119_10640 [Algoriphagus jejuensis]|uniref:DUF3347 domain-containing protein n=1 Tax=Algoriphagus jejuensis TaxID=419934 RepID=A0ABP3Y9H6_9BACT
MKKSLIFALALSAVLFSCGGKTDSHEGHDMDHATGQESETPATTASENKATTAIIDSYLAVKDALVADDQAATASKSAALVTALKEFDASAGTEELKSLQQEASSSAEKLASEVLAAQRENFQALSVTLTEFLKITGTDRTLYQQHCPMYNQNTGGIWLSASEEIKNPLFGSKMLTCGRVQETLVSL